MKNSIFLIPFFIVAVMAVPSWAASPIATQAAFANAVRNEVNISSTDLLPDTTLNEICERAVVWVSVDIGGVEAQYRIVTVSKQAFYVVADSITAILHATMLSNDGGTRTIKAWYPQFYQEITGVPGSEGYVAPPIALSSINPVEDEVPLAYHYWADTLQMMPIPTDAGDTIIIKCFVEHPILDTTAATDDVVFTHSAYTEAAIDYTCYKILRMFGRLEEAAFYRADYDRQRQVLIQKYTRGFNVVRGTQ